MKTLSKTVLGLYVLILLWLVLFKFSYDIAGVLSDYQSRSLNLIPFAGYSRGNAREMVDNLIAFLPLGLLLGVNLKQATFWQKLAGIFAFSVIVEILQGVFAIGVSDITDVIANTLGGLIGLGLYGLGSKIIDQKKLDWVIVIIIMALLIALLLLRTLVFKVKY